MKRVMALKEAREEFLGLEQKDKELKGKMGSLMHIGHDSLFARKIYGSMIAGYLFIIMETMQPLVVECQVAQVSVDQKGDCRKDAVGKLLIE